MKTLLAHLPTLLAGILAVTPAAVSHGQEGEKRFERMWLPASAQHLRPFLLMAMERALEDQTCSEVLYARLNEYRTIYEEPTFTILCKKDYKTTFNKIYHITEIDPDFNSRIAESQAAAANADNLSGAIEALRQQLVSPSEVITPPPPASEADSDGEQDSLPLESTSEPGVPMLQEDPNDLSLDLDLGAPSNP